MNRQKALWLVRKLTAIIAFAFLSLALYAAFWAIWYRLPHEPIKTVDKRRSNHDQPFYISFCASLADNPHGYPGHCYLVWSTTPPQADLTKQISAAYLPRYFSDELRSLWTGVPGYMTHDAARGNMRNLDMLIVMVSEPDYVATQQVSYSWSTNVFQVGVRDCVRFANTIACQIKLSTPDPNNIYPQDYVRRLKQIN